MEQLETTQRGYWKQNAQVPFGNWSRGHIKCGVVSKHATAAWEVLNYLVFQVFLLRQSSISAPFFFHLFMTALGLYCFAQAFSSFGKWGATLLCSVMVSYCDGFSCWGVKALGTRASVVATLGLTSCGWKTLEHRLSSCSSRALLLWGMWNLPSPGIELMSPALAGRFLITEPSGKSLAPFLFAHFCYPLTWWEC